MSVGVAIASNSLTLVEHLGLFFTAVGVKLAEVQDLMTSTQVNETEVFVVKDADVGLEAIIEKEGQLGVLDYYLDVKETKKVAQVGELAVNEAGLLEGAYAFTLAGPLLRRK